MEFAHEPTAQQTSFVYDVRTGEVVHIHQFCPLEKGGRCSETEMEKAALSLAPEDISRTDLSVLHHSGELELNPASRYRVDPGRKKYIEERMPSAPSRRQLEGKRRRERVTDQKLK